MKIFKRIFTKEAGLVVLVFLLAVFITKFPSVYYSFQNDPVNWFVGHAEWFDQKDINTYISHIRTGEMDGLLIKNRYTLTEHPGALVFIPYSALGIVNRLLDLDHIFLFHISTIFSAFLLVLSCYLISKFFFKNKLFRYACLIAIVFGGGLGWLFPESNSLDLKGAGFTLVNALERTHDALSTAFLILSVFSAFRFLENGSKKFIFLSAVFAFLQVINHPPFMLFYLLIYLVLSIIIYRESRTKTFLFAPITLLLLFIPYFALFLYPFINNPGFGSIVGQNLWNIEPLSLVLGLGVLMPFVFLFLFKKNKDRKEIYLGIIFLIQLALLISPLGFRLYFLKGLFVWIVLMSFLYISQNKFLLKNALLISVFVITITSLTRVYMLNQMLNINKNNPFYFLSYSDKNAFDFIERDKNSNVLSLYLVGNSIPAHTYSSVFYGHFLVTPNAKDSEEVATEFYLSMNPNDQRKFLEENNIRYVYYGLEEAIRRKENSLKYKDPFPYLKKVFRSKKAIIYRYN